MATPSAIVTALNHLYAATTAPDLRASANSFLVGVVAMPDACALALELLQHAAGASAAQAKANPLPTAEASLASFAAHIVCQKCLAPGSAPPVAQSAALASVIVHLLLALGSAGHVATAGAAGTG